MILAGVRKLSWCIVGFELQSADSYSLLVKIAAYSIDFSVSRIVQSGIPLYRTSSDSKEHLGRLGWAGDPHGRSYGIASV